MKKDKKDRVKKDGFDRNMFDVFDNKPHSAI